MTQHVDFSAEADPSSSKPPLYRLSALLEGHTDDVRSLCGTAASELFSTSRDGTARKWVRKGPREGQTGGWKQTELWEGQHQGFVNSCAWFTLEGQQYLATGGQDTIIQIYPLDPSRDSDPSPEPLAESSPAHTLLGHMHNVCCLHTSSDGRRIVSGSWDCTARVWETSTWSSRLVLADHGAAVWDVLAIDSKGYNDTCLTACADGLIRLFEGARCKTLFKGHQGPVRALAKVLPDDPDGNLFASASNDETIRIWNLDGDVLTSLEGHSSFIYALISIPTASGGGLASSGEDGIIKIWNDEDGEEDQEILVPALSVWTLTSLANGDLACGCSDNLVWVFTRDEARAADAVTTADYEARLAKRVKPSTTSSSASLPIADAEVLEAPGAKDGDLKLVAKDGSTHAFQWSTASLSWTDLGEVVDAPSATPAQDQPPPAKTMHEGQAYDLVFSIDVKDDEPPSNCLSTTATVAERFVAQHSLPASYQEQIEEFIRFNSQ
ncbi:WD40-repeat-containing domain protein [Leucosporidium creatinivorum]|uniref:WD40-repeat-containing domain protein n=1 Tax=Leucosporidium creatinivorum TaxID=106004 RepID=A0A1Y2D7S8_9BASI|nr:WD40-repeat-containing domain protein [Leucosporidium creatinivorum]